MNYPKTILLILFIIIFTSTGLNTISNLSYTDNEPIYILAGYYYLTQGEIFFTGHPILTHIIAATPLLFIDVDVPKPEEIYHPYQFARKEFLYYGENDADKIMFWARLPFLMLSIIFGIFVFKWVDELYGFKAGVLSLILYSLHPDIIWNSIVVMTDLSVAGFIFISCYYLWKYITKSEKKYLYLIGLFFGLGILSKSTAIFILPVFLISFLIFRKFNLKYLVNSFVTILIISGLLFIIVNIGDMRPIYDSNDPFHSQFPNSRSTDRLENLVSMFKVPFVQKILIYGLKDISVPGSASIQAYVSQSLHSKQGHTQYILGNFYRHGVWYFYLVAYMIKTPIALLILFFTSLILLFKYRDDKFRSELILLAPILFFLFILSFIIKLNLGLRHSLIILFFMIVLSTKVVQITKFNQGLLPKIIGSVLILWYIGAFLFIHPYHVAYFNEFVGGPGNGPKYLLDSSIDMGQDLKSLKKYIDDNSISNIKLRFTGFEKPEYRNIKYEYLTCEPTTGFIGISVSPLYGHFWAEALRPDYNLTCFEWLRREEPIEKIGYSIYIYNITKNSNNFI